MQYSLNVHVHEIGTWSCDSFEFIKDAMSVMFRAESVSSSMLTICKLWNLLAWIWETAKYSYPCKLKYYRIKMNLLRLCGPLIRLCLYTFRPIASKQLNSLTIIVTFNRLGCVEVTTALGARGLGFKFRLRQRGFILLFGFVCCCCCVLTIFTIRHETKVVCKFPKTNKCVMSIQ